MLLTSSADQPRLGIVVTSLHGRRRDMLPFAIDATGKHMLLNFNTLAAIMGAAHGIEPAQVPALISRLKYMRTHGFPAPGPDRRTREPSLGIEEALKVALAFEFLQSGMTPIRSIRLARTDWEEFSSIVAKARMLDTEETLAVFEPRALLEAARMDVRPEEPLNEIVGAMTPAAFAETAANPKARSASASELKRDTAIGRSVRLMAIDGAHFLQSFAIASELAGAADRKEVERALDEWCRDVIGTTEQPVELALT